MSLFPSDNAPKYPVEFRAGMMFRDKNMIVSDTRKGMVFLHQSEGLLHFCWKDRKTGKVEEDWIVFPEDAVFEKVPECKTGRVFLLKILSAEIKAFFWMQEPKEDKDEYYLKAVNRLINSSMESFGDFGGDANPGQLYQMFQEFSNTAAQSSSSSTTTTTTTTTPSTSSTNASSSTSSADTQMQDILSSISTTSQPAEETSHHIKLSATDISTLLHESAIRNRFFGFLNQNSDFQIKDDAEIEEIRKREEFASGLKKLNEGLTSGSLADWVVSDLALDPSVVGPLGGIEALIRAIQAKKSQ